jgi:hypothetical protein
MEGHREEALLAAGRDQAREIEEGLRQEDTVLDDADARLRRRRGVRVPGGATT